MYTLFGAMLAPGFRNPCSGLVPSNAKAVAIHVRASNATAGGKLYAFSPEHFPPVKMEIVGFGPEAAAQDDAGVMLSTNGAFTLLASDAGTDLTVDVIGYFTADPIADIAGPTGPTGATGPTGPTSRLRPSNWSFDSQPSSN